MDPSVRNNAMSAIDLLVFLFGGKNIQTKDIDTNFDVFKGISIGIFIMLQKLDIRPSEIVEELAQHYQDNKDKLKLFRSLKKIAKYYDKPKYDKSKKDISYEIVGPTFSLLLALFPLVLDGIKDEKAFKGREGELQFLCCLILPIAAKASSLEHATIKAYERISEFLKAMDDTEQNPTYRLIRKGPNAIFDPGCLPNKFKDLGKYEDDESYYPPLNLN